MAEVDFFTLGFLTTENENFKLKYAPNSPTPKVSLKLSIVISYEVLLLSI